MNATMRTTIAKEGLNTIIFYFTCPRCKDIVTCDIHALAPPVGWPKCEMFDCDYQGHLVVEEATVVKEL